MMDTRAIGEKLTAAGRLAGRAVCVIGGEDPFPGSVHLKQVDRCVARAIYKLAMVSGTPPISYGADSKEGTCTVANAFASCSTLCTSRPTKTLSRGSQALRMAAGPSSDDVDTKTRHPRFMSIQAARASLSVSTEATTFPWLPMGSPPGPERYSLKM